MSPLSSTRSTYCGKILRWPGPRSAGRPPRSRTASSGRAVHGPVAGVVVERKTLVRAGGREADDVAVGADAARHPFAQLQQHAGRIRVRIGDVQGLVGLEVGDVGEAVGGIVDPCRCGRGFRLWTGTTVVTATPAAARPAPPMNLRRPTSTIRSQCCDMAITPRVRQYAYRRGFLGLRPVRLPAGALDRCHFNHQSNSIRYVETSRHIQ